MTVSRDFIDSYSPKPRRHRIEMRAAPLATHAKRGGTMTSRRPRNLAQGVDILAQDSLLLPYLADAASELLHQTNSATSSRRMSRAIAPRFLTSCLPASLIIRSSLWDARGTRRRPEAHGQNSPDRLEPTVKVRLEMALGKKTARVQYLRAIRPSFPAEGTCTLEVGFVNRASLMFPVRLSQGVFEGRRCGVPT